MQDADKFRQDTPEDLAASESTVPLKFELTPGMIQVGILWMVLCSIFSLTFIGYAFYEYSIEAMWGSFIAAGLAGIPILYIIFGRTMEAAYWFRKELVITGIVGAVVFCVYLLGRAISKSNIHVETAGMQEMVTNEHFTKTLITSIICISIIIIMIPVARMLLKSSAMRTYTDRYQLDSHQDMHVRHSENATSIELRRLELTHELQMQQLELEKQWIQNHADYTNQLVHNPQLLLTTANVQTPPHHPQPPAPLPPHQTGHPPANQYQAGAPPQAYPPSSPPSNYPPQPPHAPQSNPPPGPPYPGQ